MLAAIGLVVFLAGGAALAFLGESLGTPIGTVLGVTGLGMMAYALVRGMRGGPSDR